MANVESHPPGSFCWIELGTTDQNAAKRFYESLFGWAATDSPMGPDAFYTMFSLEGRNVGGCYTLMPDMHAAGVPTHWLLYVSVANVHETAAKVAKAGGNVMSPPFDVMEHGRMAILKDPAGAVIAAWQAKKHTGTGIEGVPGTLCWADLMTPDQERAASFYHDVFGWETDASKDDSGYLHIKTGDKHIGGIPKAQFRNSTTPPHWQLYFYVKDSDASTAKAEQLGAHVFMHPTSMEGVGRWSVVSDPQGAAFALFQPEHR
jgi:hypothetical protein